MNRQYDISTRVMNRQYDISTRLMSRQYHISTRVMNRQHDISTRVMNRQHEKATGNHTSNALCSSVGRAWRLQNQGCGFDSHAGQL